MARPARGIWATGKFWWQIPRIVRVELKGRLAPGVTGKDVIVALAGNFNKDEVLNAAIEFVGDGIAHLSVDERMTIANMTTEWGAVAGVFPADDRLRAWYEATLRTAELRRFMQRPSPTSQAPVPTPSSPSATPQAQHPRLNPARVEQTFAAPLRADSDAHYATYLSLDLSTLVPHISGPNSVKVSNPLPALLDPPIRINKAYLVSCTNSRASDIAAAADVVRGRKIAPGVEFYIAAASSVVQADAERAGDWQALIDAGAKTLPAGCGPCIGLGVGLLEKGEVGISATNRNYKGRMGHPEAIAYLASPAVVAASAIRGQICGPDSLNLASLPPYDTPVLTLDQAPKQAASEGAPTEAAAASEGILAGFPASFKGPMVFAPQDNLTTDGMYPGKYTYQDDITPERQAEVVMGEPCSWVLGCPSLTNSMPRRKLRPRLCNDRRIPQAPRIRRGRHPPRRPPRLGLQLWYRVLPRAGCHRHQVRWHPARHCRLVWRHFQAQRHQQWPDLHRVSRPRRGSHAGTRSGRRARQGRPEWRSYRFARGLGRRGTDSRGQGCAPAAERGWCRGKDVQGRQHWQECPGTLGQWWFGGLY